MYNVGANAGGESFCKSLPVVGTVSSVNVESVWVLLEAVGTVGSVGVVCAFEII